MKISSPFSTHPLFDKKKYSCHFAFNPLNAELNPISHLLALLGAHIIFHVSGLRVYRLKPERFSFSLLGKYFETA